MDVFSDKPKAEVIYITLQEAAFYYIVQQVYSNTHILHATSTNYCRHNYFNKANCKSKISDELSLKPWATARMSSL